MILLDNFSGAGKPVVRPGLGDESEVVGQRRACLGLKPAMRRSVKVRIFGVIDIGRNGAPDAQEEVMFDTVRRSAEMQPLGADCLGELAPQIAMRSHLSGGP